MEKGVRAVSHVRINGESYLSYELLDTLQYCSRLRKKMGDYEKQIWRSLCG